MPTMYAPQGVISIPSVTNGTLYRPDPILGSINAAANDVGSLLESGFTFNNQTPVPIISVTSFPGVDPTGVADSTAGFQAAINSLSANGGYIYIPQGVYSITSVAINKPVTFVGAGYSGSQIYSRDATSDVINITVIGVTIRDLNFNASVTRTAGSFILCNTTSSIVTIENCYMLNWFYGIRIISPGGPFFVLNVTMRNGVPASGQGCRIENGGDVNLTFLVVDAPNASKPDSAITVTNCFDLTMFGCELQHCNYAMSLVPGAGQVITSVYAVNSFFDNSGVNGLRILPLASTGTVTRGRFNGCWFSSSSGSGIIIDTVTNVGSGVDGITFIDPEIFLNASHGVQLFGSGTTNIKFLGGKIAQNTGSGILVNANVSSWQIIGATIGPVGALLGNTSFGIQILAGTSNKFLIAHNDLSGNTGGPYSNGSTGTDRRVIDNIGYNSLAGRTSAITVAASPFTYTAGDSPETVYVIGGTVSSVTVDGLAIFATTNVSIRLSPGKATVVTYTVAPTMAKTQD